MRKIVIFVLALLLVATVWKLCGEVVLRFLWLLTVA